jgi:ferredoxin-NADP reductase
MDNLVKILSKEHLTHDVIRLRLEKPTGFDFTAGQAVEVSLREELPGTRSPFTLTSLNTTSYLELIFKIYEAHRGMTLALSKKEAGDTIFISDAWDSFKVKGPGTFIAGGTGITPFIAILRQLQADGTLKGSALFFSNKTKNDIFLGDEFSRLLGNRYYNILTREGTGADYYGRIDLDFLVRHIRDYAQPFYICGPANFVEDIQGYLSVLGANKEMVELSL